MSGGLAPFRARLDEIDDEIVRLLGERFQICREVAVHKSENEIPMMQPGRVEIVRARYLAARRRGRPAGRLHRRPLRPADRRHLPGRGRADGAPRGRRRAADRAVSACRRGRGCRGRCRRSAGRSGRCPASSAAGERYGDAFTLRIRHWGDWVLLADPDDVKRVFTAGDAVGVDVANPLLGPVLGPRSVMLLEEPDHMRRRSSSCPPSTARRSPTTPR